MVAFETKIPLLIVGPPGCSKSLAQRIVMDSLRGSKSSNPFLKRFKQMNFDLRTYQCSEHSESAEVRGFVVARG